MIITLKTTSRDDPSKFSNFFPEGLKIPPKASIGLVNSSFTIEKAFAISVANNTFEIRIGNQTLNSTITIPIGNYANSAALAEAAQTALQTWIGTLSPELQGQYPVASQTVTVDDKNIITISLVYDQTNIALLNFNLNNAPINVFLKDGADITGDAGDYIAFSPDLGNSAYLVSSDFANNNFLLGATSAVATSFSAIFRFASPRLQNTTDIYAILTDPQVTTAPVVRIQCDWQAGTIDILELIAGTPSSILSATLTTVNNAEFTLEIPQFAEGATASKSIKYSYNNVDIVPDPLAQRYAVQATDKFYTAWIPDQDIKVGELLTDPATNVGSTQTFEDFGSEYRVGEVLNQASVAPAGGNGFQIQVKQINPAGNNNITQYFIKSYGTGYSQDDVITFDHHGGGTDPVKLKLTVVGPPLTLGAAGNGYSNGTATLNLVAGGWVTGATAPEVTITTGGGAVTSITAVTQKGTGVVAGTEYALIQGGGDGNARVTINAVEDGKVPCSLGIQASLVTDDGHYPLQSQDRQRLIPSAGFRALTHLPANSFAENKGGLQAVGSSAMSHNDTSSHILHVQIDEFQLESREGQSETQGGPNGKTIGVICAGAENPSDTGNEGFFYKEQFNVLYNKCDNPQTVNHNELNVRLTDEMNNPFVGLKHPVILTVDLKPELL